MLIYMHAVPSGTPSNLQGVTISSTSIRLTWDPPEPGDQNGVIQAYNIIITEVVTGSMMYFQEGGMVFILTVNTLHPYYTYQCSISAETIGAGPAANISVTTHQGGIATIKLQYHIVGNFCGRKLSQSGGKKDFPEKTFVDCLLVPPKDGKSPNLEEKSFANSHKTSKFAKFFFLESFPLYGSLIQIVATGSCTTERKQNKTKQTK